MRRKRGALWQPLYSAITDVIQSTPSKAKHQNVDEFAARLADELDKPAATEEFLSQHWERNIAEHGLGQRIELAKKQIHALARTLERLSYHQRKLLPGEIGMSAEVRNLAEFPGILPESVVEHLLWEPPHWSEGVLSCAAELRDFEAKRKKPRGRPSRSIRPHWIVHIAYAEWRECFDERPGCSERSPFPSLVARLFDVAAPDERPPSYSTIAKMIQRLEVEKSRTKVE